MKWTTQELKKLVRTDNRFQAICDCKRFLAEDDPDIYDISDVSVSGEFRILEDEGIFLFDCDVSCELVMPCAITLDEVVVPVSFHTTLEFAKQFVDDDTHVFDGITIELDPVIYSEILVEKPLRVLSDHAYENYVEDHAVLDEEDDSTNPFAALKK